MQPQSCRVPEKKTAPLTDEILLKFATHKSSDTYFEHDSVNLLLDFGICKNSTILASFHQQIEEGLPLLLANVIIVHIKIVLQTGRLSKGKSFHRSVLKKNIKYIHQ